MENTGVLNITPKKPRRPKRDLGQREAASTISLKESMVKPGDKIYVPSFLYIDHGEDDVLGGWATVLYTERRWTYTTVFVIQHPHRAYNLAYLLSNQEKFAAEYGDREARPDPDMHPRPNPSQKEVAEGYAQDYLADVVYLSQTGKPYKHLLPALEYWAAKSEKAREMVRDLIFTLRG